MGVHLGSTEQTYKLAVCIKPRSLGMGNAVRKETRAIVPDKKGSMALKQNISGRAKLHDA